ncbi:hypothetical protein H0W32_01780, partial [Patescibacteria group bacterium]|nr:hypothetical protein [Patescibacteria group bacterium]
TTLSATSSLFLTMSGKVGIGTTTPTGVLSVHKDVGATVGDSYGVYSHLAGDDVNNTLYAGYFKSDWYQVSASEQGNRYGVYGHANDSSNTGFATLYGVYGKANGGVRNYGLYGTASGGFQNYAGYFDDGNVYIKNSLGIGTSSPYAKLSVAGEIVGSYFTGTSTATSTFNGNVVVGGGNSPGKLRVGTSNGGYYADYVSQVNGNYPWYVEVNNYGRPFGMKDFTFSAAAATVMGGYYGLAFGTGETDPTEAGIRMVVSQAGLVGIGTTSPFAKLSVYGSSYIDTIDNTGSSIVKIYDGDGIPHELKISGYANAPSITSSNGQINIGDESVSPRMDFIGGGGSVFARIESTSAHFSGDFDIYDTTLNTSNFKVTNAGNVGVGTTSPTSKLSVTGDTYIDGNLTISSATGGTTQLRLTNALNGPWDFTYAVNTVALKDPFGQEHVSFLRAGNTTFSKITIFNDSVGIGTSSPTEKLVVNGNVKVSSCGQTFRLNTSNDYMPLDCGGNGGIINSTANFLINIDSDNNDTNRAFIVRNNSSSFGGSNDLFHVNENGNVGVGTTSPSAKLSVTGSGTGTGRAFVVANSGNTETFTILDNGNIGIGTTTPSHKLTVQGGLCVTAGATCTSEVSGTIVADGVITQNAFDLAESYMTYDMSVEEGDIVAADPENDESIVRASGENTVLGIVSTKPGFTLGHIEGGKPVALSGRVPVKFNLENGPVKRGDYLILSSIPGEAMKAPEGISNTIGVALHNASEPGKVSVFVQVGLQNIAYSALNTPTSSSTANMITDNSGVMDSVAAVLISAKRLVAETVEAAIGIFDFIRVEKGMEIKDQVTGDIYCVTIKNGDWDKSRGDCVNVGGTTPVTDAINNPDDAPSTPEPVPQPPPGVEITPAIITPSISTTEAENGEVTITTAPSLDTKEDVPVITPIETVEITDTPS